MGNALNEDIEGRFVLIRKDWFKASLQDMAEDVRERVFLAQGGFGCKPYTMGNAVMGEFVVDGEETRVEGYNLEGRFATLEEVEAALDERALRGVPIGKMVMALDLMKVNES